MEISREVFDEERRPRFGAANPERMQLAFWEWMIQGGDDQLTKAEADEDDGEKFVPAYHARKFFKVTLSCNEGPIWTFDRVGRTCSVLPDGRRVYIGGEHEDSYDIDFCIYNDVVVFDLSGQFQMFGYPPDVFPPTDFHTATVMGDRIFIVGRLGYQNARCTGHTPVYVLETSGYRMREMPTRGENPGWLYKHEAKLDSSGLLVVTGGQVYEERDGKARYSRNLEDYGLNLESGEWTRLTNRHWRQFAIRQADGRPFVLDRSPQLKALLPAYASEAKVVGWNRITFALQCVPIELTVEIMEIQLVVQGDLPAESAERLTADIRDSAERAIGQACVVEEG